MVRGVRRRDIPRSNTREWLRSPEAGPYRFRPHFLEIDRDGVVGAVSFTPALSGNETRAERAKAIIRRGTIHRRRPHSKS